MIKKQALMTIFYNGYLNQLINSLLILNVTDSKKAVQDVLDAGKVCLLDIDMQV